MKIRISNLVDKVRNEDILKILQKYGPILEVRIIEDRYTSKNLVIVLATIQNKEKGLKAIKELSGMIFFDEIIEVKQVINSENG